MEETGKKKSKGLLKTLLGFAGPCRGRMLLSVLCAMVSVAGGFVPYYAVYRVLLIFIEKSGAWHEAVAWCLIGLGGYIVKILFYGISTVLSHISAYTILEQLRLKIADSLMRAPLGEVMSKRIGYLKDVIMDRVENVEPPLAHMIPELSSNLILPAVIFLWLACIDWRMGLSMLIAPAISLIPMMFLMKSYSSKYAAYMEANNYVNNVIVEYVEGIEVVKAFNQSSSSYAKFSDAVTSFRDFTLAWFKSTWRTMNLTFSIMPAVLLGVLPVGLILYQSRDIAPGELVMCILLSLSIVSPLMRVTTFINEIKAMKYSVEMTDELMNMSELPWAQTDAKLSGTEIVFDKVSFNYTGKKGGEVLHEVSFSVKEGSFTALVGPSGGGKSTIARLIARFWDTSGGKITIGGVNVKDIPMGQLSGLISFVTQDNFLFDCSLKENIRLGNPKASDEQVYEAAKAACCDEFIRRLDKGYDTPSGEAGKKLSGGEKQRIAIARAILKDAPIIILDEATAFTDPQNEAQIQKSVTALSKGKTLLVIAHRLSTIQKAGQIIVIEKGKIIDKGRQEELISRCPLYAKMWKAHIGAKRWAVGHSGEVL